MIKCFEPIVDDNARLLILGSMPGKESLRQQQYYAYKRNQFWKILFEVFQEDLTDNYTKKKELLYRHHIGLWDVLKSCEREGSLDSNIRNEQVNDFKGFFSNYPSIKYVVFNGSKAISSFKKHVGFELLSNFEYYQLPSTSPANTKPYEEKIRQWKLIRDLIERS